MNRKPLCAWRWVTLLAVPLFVAAAVRAQAPLEPAQMPARTSAYLIWRGAPASNARSANSLLALWDDPDFASVRAALFENATADRGAEPAKAAIARQEAVQYAALLENAFVIGYIPRPVDKTAASANKTPELSWNGGFFVYDRTGKEVLLSKAVLGLRSQNKELPKITQITIGDVPVLKIERKTGTSYWVEHGKYAAGANEPAVLEEVLARLEGKATGASSLVQSAEYQEAQPQLGGGLVEFFARMSNLKDLARDTTASGFKVSPVLDAMRLDAVHSLCGRVTLDGPKARFQAAILGDTSPGTPFDLWNEGQHTPESLALTTPEAVSYSETEFNFQGLYDLLMRAFRASVPPGQQSSANMIDAIAQTRLGMSISDALGLLTGEFASLTTSPAIDPDKGLYVLVIRKKAETLKLIRSLFGDQVTSERNEGDVTYIKISMHGSQGATGVAQWDFYHLAVTPHFVLAASRNETLRELLATRSGESQSKTLEATAQFQTARAAYPDKVDGIYYFDFQKVDWPAMKARWIESAKKASKNSTLDSQKNALSQVPSLLGNVNPEVFPRHLHLMAGASWKDSKGIHFDQWVQ
jgi:hypothetical protein